MTEFEALALAVAGKLLAYPDKIFFAGLPALRNEATTNMETLSDGHEFLQAVLGFIKRLETMGQSAAAASYVSLFDHASSATLYMSWRRYGNDRSQGQALAALNGLYRAFGFEPFQGALPDYLPLMLEFLSLAPDEGRDVLLDAFGPEINDLVKTLEAYDAVHAPVLKAALAPLMRDFPQRFKPRLGIDPTRRPMAQPEPEPADPLIHIPLQPQPDSVAAMGDKPHNWQ